MSGSLWGFAPTHNFNRTGSVKHHGLGDGPKEEPSNSAVTMRSQNNRMSPPPFGFGENDSFWNPLEGRRVLKAYLLKESLAWL